MKPRLVPGSPPGGRPGHHTHPCRRSGPDWGVVGLLIAVPVLAVVKIYCAHNDEMAPVAELLGSD